MKEFRLKIAAICLVIVGFFTLLGWAGRIDYCDQVILSMSEEEYEYVRDTLQKIDGHRPSDWEIAHWWADHN